MCSALYNLSMQQTLGLIFDFDGVLIDSESLHYRAYSEVLAEFDVQVGPDEYAAEWIATGRGPEFAVATYGLPLTPDQVRARKHPIYNALLRVEIALMPGVTAALERLAPAFPMTVATNSREADVGFVLDRFDLRGYFKAIVTRECYAQSKPEPDAFLTAARELSLEPAACLVIEDAYKGVAAAATGGFPCVAIPHALTRNNDFSGATRVLASLDELTLELIQTL